MSSHESGRLRPASFATVRRRPELLSHERSVSGAQQLAQLAWLCVAGRQLRPDLALRRFRCLPSLEWTTWFRCALQPAPRGVLVGAPDRLCRSIPPLVNTDAWRDPCLD